MDSSARLGIVLRRELRTALGSVISSAGGETFGAGVAFQTCAYGNKTLA